jgi:hypothetical protein
MAKGNYQIHEAPVSQDRRLAPRHFRQSLQRKIMTEDQYARKALLKLVAYVHSHRDGLLDGLTYEALAYQIGRRNKNGKGAGRGMGRILGKLGYMLLNLESVWQRCIPCIQCLVINKTGKNQGLPDDGIQEFWPHYKRSTQEQKQACVSQEHRKILLFGKHWKTVLSAIRRQPSMTLRDEKALRKTARLLHKELEARCQASGFQCAPNPQPVNSYTDGWYISLGKTEGKHFEAQLWLDRYARQTERRFYYGFRIRKTGTLTQLTKNVSPPFNRPALKFTQGDFEQIKTERNWWLDSRLPHYNFNKPVYEDYWKGHRFYGIYNTTKDWSPQNLERIAAKAADFLLR